LELFLVRLGHWKWYIWDCWNRSFYTGQIIIIIIIKPRLARHMSVTKEDES